MTMEKDKLIEEGKQYGLNLDDSQSKAEMSQLLVMAKKESADDDISRVAEELENQAQDETRETEEEGKPKEINSVNIDFNNLSPEQLRAFKTALASVPEKAKEDEPLQVKLRLLDGKPIIRAGRVKERVVRDEVTEKNTVRNFIGVWTVGAEKEIEMDYKDFNHLPRKSYDVVNINKNPQKDIVGETYRMTESGAKVLCDMFVCYNKAIYTLNIDGKNVETDLSAV